MKKQIASFLLLFIATVSFAQNGKDLVKVTDMLKIKTPGAVSLNKDGSKAVFTVTSIEPDGDSKLDVSRNRAADTNDWAIMEDVPSVAVIVECA